MSLNNDQCETRPFLIDLKLVEFKYYPYTTTLDKWYGNSNTLTEIPGTTCVWNKSGNVNLNIFDLITRKKKMNHKYKQNIYRVNANVNFMVKNVIKIKFRIMINDDMSAKIQ